jgi:hypothetical protein
MSTRVKSLSRRFLGIVSVFLIGASTPPTADAADPGDTSLAFLKIGIGARAAAMGEAYAAVAQDPTAVHWNPAGISTVPGREFHSTHNEWISDVRYEYLAAVQGMQGHAIGAHVGLLHMGELEERNDVGVLTGHFRAYDFTGGLTYGRRITRTIEMGATVKVLYSKIHDFSATSFATDLGVRYRTPLRGLVLAGTATNLGTPVKFEEEDAVLPFGVRLAAAYRTRRVLSGLLLASDLRIPNDSDVRGHLGAELWVHQVVAIRGGLKLNYDEEMGAVGLGVRYGDFLVDYAFVPFSDSSELGDTHRVSLGWRPGFMQSEVAAP